ncbi:transcriptional regulatory protein AlgP-like [Schistocerca gregaria]|uniref:transcriptional regulatory protein AlgP-like n=1 Tax=Schistocerca gregaria TaxID=7010 RepID=UPI00211F17E1|nr:transcriptional regulatory protein AlgP-like [Schistocerca gregaria]
MCSRGKDVPALASNAKGVADRRPAALAPPVAPSGPPLMTTSAMAMDLMDTAPETLKTELPDSDDESSTAPQPRGRSGKQKRRATAAVSAVRSSPIEKRAKQDFAPDADGFVPARRTARRMQSSTTLPTAVANSLDALADAPDQLPRDPAPKKDSHLPPVVLQFRPPYGELQKLLRSWTTAVYTVKPARRDLYRVTLRAAADYRRVTQEASERGCACPRPPTEKPTCALCGGAQVASYRGCEVWKRAIAHQRGQTPAPHPKKPATRRPGASFAAATSGAPSAVPAASAPPAPAASVAIPTPEAPAPTPQMLVADPSTASPGTSPGPRSANRRRGGHRPVGTRRSAPSVEQPQVDSHSDADTPPPSSDGAAPAASTADLANLVAQLTALVTSTMKLIEVLSQQLSAAVRWPLQPRPLSPLTS